jgi:glycosyltransferase involved in cell wall biosynthesis
VPEPQPEVFLVGPRYRQHSAYSGYEGFRRHIGTQLTPPVQERWSAGAWGARADRLLARLTKEAYSVPILRIELAAARHMLIRRRAVYHVLYGDSDVWMLGHVGRWTGNPVVATFHEGAAVLQDLEIERPLLSRLAGAILLSESQRPYFERRMRPERVFVVPHGVHTGFFMPAAEPGRQDVCITVGGHTRDFGTLTRALEIVWKANPAMRCVAISTQLGNKGRPFVCEGVEFRSRLTDEELRREYQSARVAVFAFEWAVANNAMLEAMACGLPIVATDVGGVREYLGPEAGILCPPGDAAALAQAIRQVFENPIRAAAMGAAARRRAARYDYAVVADQLRGVYEASLGFHRSPLPVSPADG